MPKAIVHPITVTKNAGTRQRKRCMLPVAGIDSFYSFEHTPNGTLIDSFIAEFIADVNNHGLKTTVSCSGTAGDHGGTFRCPYFSIDVAGHSKRTIRTLLAVIAASHWNDISQSDTTLFFYPFQHINVGYVDALGNNLSDDNIIQRWLDLFTLIPFVYDTIKK